eukprot:gene19420-19313_t
MRVLLTGLIAAAILLAAPAGAAPSVHSNRSTPDRASDVEALEKRLLARIDQIIDSDAKDCPKARPDLVAYSRSPAFAQ